ncbi:hypothetical protein [Gordonia zhaorongruii]|uniref:hypothetical protein n=1 Tax=Gordonia zhaorongruii TaxID=2597659 RepID=UPI00104D042B|nr:hypothetical protein [Gordonia zhaorongruii]
MSSTGQALVLAVFIIATSIWIGGYFAIAVVARAATRTLAPSTRVDFFRALGRMYFWVGAPALIIALATGGVLAHNHASGGLFVTICIVAALLLVSFAVAVAQARRMTRLRRRLTAEPETDSLQTRVTREARTAGLLRAALGVFSLALVFLGAFLAV